MTASSIADITGHGYNSRWKQFDRYTKNKGSPPQTDDWNESAAMNWGHEMEPVAIEELEVTNPTFQKYGGVQPGLIWHPSPIVPIGATLDKLYYDSETDTVINVEIKCPFYKRPPLMKEDIALKYLIQVQIQMACTGIKVSYLYFWHKECTSLFKVQRDDLLIWILIEDVYQFREDLKMKNRGSDNRKNKKKYQNYFDQNLNSMVECVEIRNRVF